MIGGDMFKILDAERELEEFLAENPEPEIVDGWKNGLESHFWQCRVNRLKMNIEKARAE